MTDWAIGDIQGCAKPFFEVLTIADFNPSRDTLWVAGDIVNRGPDNLSVLRYLQSLNESVKIVLGNHDLHLLAVSVGAKKLSAKDTIHDVIAAKDSSQLIDWLAQQPLIQTTDRYIMSHAGVPHIWTDLDCEGYADEVHHNLKGTNTRLAYLSHMYGNSPATWNPSLSGFDRLRAITNYLTRMRFIDPSGMLDFTAKENIANAPEGFQPWFNYPRQVTRQVIFGHWAALSGVTREAGIHALDTGCVWGGSLTLFNLASQERISVPCSPRQTLTNNKI